MIPIKTEADLRKMRHAALILQQALQAVEAAIHPGVSTLELDQLVESLIVSKGAIPGFKGYNGFPASICASVNEEVVHGIPSANCILADGDIVGVDCGVYYDGFHTDACRTFLVGDPLPEVRHFVKITKKALDNAVKVIRHGAHVGDISAVIQKTIEDQGYSPVVECTGHGVGRDLHEPPEILNAGRKGTGPMLQAGMVLAVEPISTMGNGDVETLEDGWTVVSADGTPSAHFEHTILVTKNGSEILV
ncbi:type I methionyl aminopeptidase [Candidatus Peregrinibacteria bacterium CG_4_10_14_0_2_um_filter_43_11]|nr:MAG: type I methionyl aminopeptidase [Candidatus Peregrinibacteria bacterium CG_4_10_14_0_2_um_filter_43_11]